MAGYAPGCCFGHFLKCKLILLKNSGESADWVTRISSQPSELFYYFRLNYEYEIEYEYDFSILVFWLHIITAHTHFIP